MIPSATLPPLTKNKDTQFDNVGVITNSTDTEYGLFLVNPFNKKSFTYSIKKKDLPPNTNFSVGDALSYELTAGSTATSLKPCNFIIKNKEAYYDFIKVANEFLDLPSAIILSLSKIKELCLLICKQVDLSIVDSEIVSIFEEIYGLVAVYTVRYLKEGEFYHKRGAEPLVVFEIADKKKATL